MGPLRFNGRDRVQGQHHQTLVILTDKNSLGSSAAATYSDLMNSTVINRKSARKSKANSSAISSGRWAAYAAAGVASTAALAPSAEAEVHYSGLVNYDFAAHGGEGAFPLSPGVNLVVRVGVPDGTSAFGHAFVSGANGAFAGRLGFYTSPSAYSLAKGVQLSAEPFPVSCRFSSSNSTQVCYYSGANFGSEGHFRNRGAAFFGFEFTDGTGRHYGWARVQLTGAPKYRFQLVDYAYADAGESLQTGQKKSRHQASATPSGSLGLLAVGGVGLRAWRAQK
jgi:hypothetical protein